MISKKVIIVLSSGLLFITLVSGAYFFIHQERTKELEKKIQIVTESVSTLGSLTDPTPDTILERDKEIDKVLSSDLPQTEESRSIWIARKASNLSNITSTTSVSQRNTASSTALYNKVLLSTSVTDLAYDVALAGYMRIFFNYAYPSSVYQALPESLKNKTIVTSNSTANRLAIFAFLPTYAKGKNDLTIITQGSFFKATILRSFDESLTPAQRKLLLDDLQNEINAYQSLIPITYPPYVSGRVHAALMFAVAYDIYQSNVASNSNKAVVNSAINSNYERVLTLLDNKELVKDTVTSQYIRFYHAIYFIDSLTRRYDSNNKEATMLIKKTLDEFLSLVESVESPYKEAFASYLISASRGDTTWDKARGNFIALANTEPKLMEYFRSIRLNKNDIEQRKITK